MSDQPSMAERKFKISHVPPETLRPYFRNTKIHSEAQLRQMVQVIDRYYFDQPIVVTPDLVIIKGHGRYMASLRTKEKRLVPIIIRDDLTDEQIMAARISDNRLFELGEPLPELIKSEVVDFVAEGGQGAHTFFDFAPPPAKAPTISPPAVPKVQVMTTNVQPPVQSIAPAPKPPAAAKPAPAVFCPNCGQIHEVQQ